MQTVKSLLAGMLGALIVLSGLGAFRGVATYETIGAHHFVLVNDDEKVVGELSVMKDGSGMFFVNGGKEHPEDTVIISAGGKTSLLIEKKGEGKTTVSTGLLPVTRESEKR